MTLKHLRNVQSLLKARLAEIEAEIARRGNVIERKQDRVRKRKGWQTRTRFRELDLDEPKSSA
jgi:hypothetical protein